MRFEWEKMLVTCLLSNDCAPSKNF
uniref:Uncharacterized protein n=1 Tax=Arundo donax TaxID=35708 RepID=A0A0A8Z1K9_ARUDO